MVTVPPPGTTAGTRLAVPGNLRAPRRQQRVLACLTGLVVLVGLAPAAAASGIAPATADCNAHGLLTRSYTVQQLKTALNTMPADIAEYTDCRDVIDRQLLAQLGRPASRGQGGGGGSFLPTPVIVILIVLGLMGAAYAALVVRQRRTG